jgi:hypothetical protein
VIGRGARNGPVVQLGEHQAQLEAQPPRGFRVEAAAEASGERCKEERSVARLAQDLAEVRGLQSVVAFLLREPIGARLSGERKEVLPHRAVEAAEAGQERLDPRRRYHVALSSWRYRRA